MLRMDAAFCGGFVDADARDAGQIHAGDGGVNVVEDDAPQALVGDAEKACGDGNRQVHGERHGEAFEQQREAGTRPRPGHRDEAHAALRAGDARRARGEKRLMLKEIQMPPRFFGGVVHGAIGGLALGTIEPAAGLEVERDVEALVVEIEVGGGDEPRRLDAERELQKMSVAHVGHQGCGSILAPSMPPCRVALKDKPPSGGALKSASFTAARHDGKRSANSIKPHSDPSTAPDNPLRMSRSQKTWLCFDLMLVHEMFRVDRAEGVMADDTYQRLQALIALMSPTQLDALERAIRERRGGVLPPDPQVIRAMPAPAARTAPLAVPPPATDTISTIEAAFQAAPACPHCQSSQLQKWGAAHALRRYRCRNCKKTFNALTGTPLAQLHNRELWQPHAQALLDGLSLRKVAGRIGVCLDTAFRWRHRFLKAPKALKAQKLQGIVEADETFFLYSEKGQRKLSRKPRKRGGKAAKCGLSAEQIPVLIARDRTKATTDQILPDRSEKSVTAVLQPVVAKDAVLVTDGDKSFGAYADKARILHISLVASKGEHAYEDYHFQHVNAYISGLKRWMPRFNGVATKYLDTYLGWNRLNDRDGSTLTANSMLIASLG